MPTLITLDDAVYKWFSQLHSSGLAVQGIEIQAAAERLSKQMGLEQFKANSGWLFRFCQRNNISSKKICGEILSADLFRSCWSQQQTNPAENKLFFQANECKQST
jgi:hypothetical protein